MSNQSEINEFYQYFSDEIQSISSLNNKLYQKILYACILDTLGLARYPKAKRDTRKRIVSFIRNCSKWGDCDRVSIVQLHLSLKHIYKQNCGPELQGSNLYTEVSKRFSSQEPRIENDPFFNEIINFANIDETKIVKANRYVELFFAYRNALVHSFKEPGYPSETRSDSEPFYLTWDSRPPSLVFPSNFLKMICNECLCGLKDYLIEKDINPYKIYEKTHIFGNIWIDPDRLNKFAIKNSCLNKLKKLITSIFTRFR
jgi:hypothetical protein